MKNIYIVGTDAGIITCLESLISTTDNFKVIGRSLKASNFLMELKTKSGLLDKIDLLLIDPKLPDTNGLELIPKVQSKNKDINIGILLNENLKKFFLNDISNYGIEETNIIIYPNNDEIYYLNKLNSIFEKIEDNKISDEFTSKFIPDVKKESDELINKYDNENILTQIGITNNYLDLFNFDNINKEELKKLAEIHGWKLPNDGYESEVEENISENKETIPENIEYKEDENKNETEHVEEDFDIGFENNIIKEKDEDVNIKENPIEPKKKSLDDIIGNMDIYNPTENEIETDVHPIDEHQENIDYMQNKEEIDNFEIPSLNRKDSLDENLEDKVEDKVEVEFNENEVQGTYDYDNFLKEFSGIPKVSNNEKTTPAPIDFEDEPTPNVYKEKEFEDFNKKEETCTPPIDDYKKDTVPSFNFGEDFNSKSIEDEYEGNINGFTNNPQKPYKNLPNFSKQIVAFYSSKGGIGKTSTAVNTAIMLSKYSSKRICIVDLDLSDPNVHIQLGIKDNKYDLADVADTEGLIDSLSIKKCITKFEKEDDKGLIAKFDVIVGFKSKKYLIQKFNEKEIDRLLSILEDMYDIVLVDTNPEYSNNIAVSTVLKKCTKLIFVTQQDLSAITGSRDFLLMMNEYKMPLQKIFFVLNKYSPIGGISQSQIEDTLGRKIMADIIKDDELMLTSINTREPITISKSESVLSESYKEIAKIVDTTIPLDTKKKKDKGIFKKFHLGKK